MNRNLDGIYFRIFRDEKWQNICFSDLDDAQMDMVLETKSVEWCRDMCKILGKKIKEIGDIFNIIGEDD